MTHCDSTEACLRMSICALSSTMRPSKVECCACMRALPAGLQIHQPIPDQKLLPVTQQLPAWAPSSDCQCDIALVQLIDMRCNTGLFYGGALPCRKGGLSSNRARPSTTALKLPTACTQLAMARFKLVTICHCKMAVIQSPSSVAARDLTNFGCNSSSRPVYHPPCLNRCPAASAQAATCPSRGLRPHHPLPRLLGSLLLWAAVLTRALPHERSTGLQASGQRLLRLR